MKRTLLLILFAFPSYLLANVWGDIGSDFESVGQDIKNAGETAGHAIAQGTTTAASAVKTGFIKGGQQTGEIMSQIGQTGQAFAESLDNAFKGQQGQELETQLMTEFENVEKSDDD